MTMELEQRQVLRSALQQYGRYDYPLNNRDWHVYLTVGQGEDGYWWARWCTEQNINDVEYFERSRRRRFDTRNEAIDWLYTDYKEPYTDQTQPPNQVGGLRPPR